MRKALIAGLAAVLVVMAGRPGLADQGEAGSLRIERPWARASIGAVKAGAAYLRIVNRGEVVDRLIATATPVAEHAALHTHLMAQGVMKMRPLETVEVAPGEPTVLKPGGLHIMLMGLRRPLREGETFPLALTFRRAGTIEVEVEVLKATSMGHKALMEHPRPHHADAPKTNCRAIPKGP
jgi:copper(I)-binding protein